MVPFHCEVQSYFLTTAVTLLDGVANSGMVELGDVRLAAYLAEKKPSGHPFFKNGQHSAKFIYSYIVKIC